MDNTATRKAMQTMRGNRPVNAGATRSMTPGTGIGKTMKGPHRNKKRTSGGFSNALKGFASRHNSLTKSRQQY